jgi:hypothetical protein
VSLGYWLPEPLGLWSKAHCGSRSRRTVSLFARSTRCDGGGTSHVQVIRITGIIT